MRFKFLKNKSPNSLSFNFFAKVVKKMRFTQLSAVFCEKFHNFVAQLIFFMILDLVNGFCPTVCEDSGVFHFSRFKRIKFLKR
jgi:hypothetical protein